MCAPTQMWFSSRAKKLRDLVPLLLCALITVRRASCTIEGRYSNPVIGTRPGSGSASLELGIRAYRPRPALTRHVKSALGSAAPDASTPNAERACAARGSGRHPPESLATDCAGFAGLDEAQAIAALSRCTVSEAAREIILSWIVSEVAWVVSGHREDRYLGSFLSCSGQSVRGIIVRGWAPRQEQSGFPLY